MKSFIIPKNSTPRKTAVSIIAIPVRPMSKPKMMIAPSFPIRPKEVTKIPTPGMKLLSGSGNRTDVANIKIKNPTILSKIPLLRNVSLGLRTFSALAK